MAQLRPAGFGSSHEIVRNTRPGFLGAGVLLVVIGLAILGWLFIPSGPPHDADDLHPGVSGQASLGPWQGWSFIGGLSLAAGLGCIGIGMNRWTSAR